MNAVIEHPYKKDVFYFSSNSFR